MILQNLIREESERAGIPYQTLINLYLTDCAKNKGQLRTEWEKAEKQICFPMYFVIKNNSQKDRQIRLNQSFWDFLFSDELLGDQIIVEHDL